MLLLHGGRWLPPPLPANRSPFWLASTRGVPRIRCLQLPQDVFWVSSYLPEGRPPCCGPLTGWRSLGIIPPFPRCTDQQSPGVVLTSVVVWKRETVVVESGR